MKALFFFIILNILVASGIHAQPGLIPKARAVVYRIEQPALYEGTGVIYTEGKYDFLITNYHMVKNDSGKVCDSLFLYVNHITDNGEVISGPDHVTIHLVNKMDTLYFKSEIAGVDIVLISLGADNVSPNIKDNRFYKLPASTIPTNEAIDMLINNESVITAVGYPAKRTVPTSIARYPEYRWGRCLGKDGSFIRMNIPVLPGSSGSPVFMEYKGEYVLVGIVTASVGGVCYSLRATAIKGCFSKYFKYISEH
jgi:V8-like Glu-specific endopeptidase